MAKKLLFIYNPQAGKGKIRSKLSDIIEVLVDGGWEVTVYPTKKRGDAVCAARITKGSYQYIVCSGGDGTLDEVVTGMMQGEE